MPPEILLNVSRNLIVSHIQVQLRINYFEELGKRDPPLASGAYL